MDDAGLDGVTLSLAAGDRDPVLSLDGIAYRPTDDTPHGPAIEIAKRWRDQAGRSQKDRQFASAFIASGAKKKSNRFSKREPVRESAAQADGRKAAVCQSGVIRVRFSEEELTTVFTAMGDQEPEEWARMKLLEAAAETLQGTIAFPKGG